MSFRVRVLLVGLWLLFTVSLTAWWLVFGLQQVDQLKELVQATAGAELDAKVLRQHQMLLWEGGILLVALLVGGISLFYLLIKTQGQSLRLKEFFATFSHDLKTSLTSLRLQVEALKEDLEDTLLKQPTMVPLFHRLMNDTIRLQVQLENSLFLANIDQQKLFLEKVKLEDLVRQFQQDWPASELRLNKSCYVTADLRAVESIFKNLIQNALTHGKASIVEINVNESSGGYLEMVISDNGRGFTGPVKNLGVLFTRPNVNSGSGVGLYLVRRLTQVMKGQVEFIVKQNHISTKLLLPGGLL